MSRSAVARPRGKPKVKTIGNIIVFGLVLALVWAVWSALGPGGWWIVTINAGFFIITIPSFIFPSVAALKSRVPYALAIILTGLLYLLTFVVIRGLFVEAVGWVVVGRRSFY